MRDQNLTFTHPPAVFMNLTKVLREGMNLTVILRERFSFKYWQITADSLHNFLHRSRMFLQGVHINPFHRLELLFQSQ